MKRALWISLLISVAIAAGVFVGEGLYRTDFARRLVLLGGSEALVRQENLRHAARSENVAEEEINRELDLLRDQFGDEAVFAKAMKFSGFTPESLSQNITDHLRARRWIEEQIAPQLGPNRPEVEQFYKANVPRFTLAKRYRVNHIFLAAPDGYPDDVIAAKRSIVQGLSMRILAGEKFTDLVAEASEDEATKSNGGDLGYFSARRMPPEFIAEIEKLHLGEISGPIRSHLGFHIVQLAEIKNSEELPFEKVQGEIALALANEKRMAVVARLAESLAQQ